MIESDRGFKIYAVIESGGKQYKVSPGQTIRVDLLPQEPGGTLELDRVLLVGDGERVITGRPVIGGARVTASVVGHERGKKVIVFKYKAKTRYRRKMGHRQPYTVLSIQDIVLASPA